MAASAEQSYETTPLMTDESEAERAQEDRVVKRRRRLLKRRSNKKDEAISKESTEESVLHSEQKKQNLIYLLHTFVWMAHLCTTLGIVGYRPEVRPLMFFHSILSPATLMVYCVGALSSIYGYLSMYRKGKLVTDLRRAQWFRRYMRSNQYLALVWCFATLATIFGCWTFTYVQELEGKHPIRELKEQVYEPIVKQIILALPQNLYRLEALYQITPSTPPLNLVDLVGRYFYVAALVLTIIPVSLLLYTQRFQRRYYTLRFLNSM